MAEWRGVRELLFSGLFVSAAARGVKTLLVLAPVLALAGAGYSATGDEPVGRV